MDGIWTVRHNKTQQLSCVMRFQALSKSTHGMGGLTSPCSLDRIQTHVPLAVRSQFHSLPGAWNLPEFSPVGRISIVTVNMECDREDSLFSWCSPMTLLVSPCNTMDVSLSISPISLSFSLCCRASYHCSVCERGLWFCTWRRSRPLSCQKSYSVAGLDGNHVPREPDCDTEQQA